MVNNDNSEYDDEVYKALRRLFFNHAIFWSHYIVYAINHMIQKGRVVVLFFGSYIIHHLLSLGLW